MSEKLLAEWFLIDRWDGSSAPLLPMEAQGIYRAMLSQAWRRGAKLPKDPESIQVLIRCKPREWKRSWPLVRPYWQEEGEHLINETQVAIYADAKARSERAQARAQAGAQARHRHQPPSPSPNTSEEQSPSSSESVPAAADVDLARRELREAIRDLRARIPEIVGTDQAVLNRPAFHSSSGGIVRIDSCTSAGLMLAVAEKVRSHGKPRERRATRPEWDSGDVESSDQMALAVAWVQQHFPADARPESRDHLARMVASVSPPDDLRDAIWTHLLFGQFPYLREHVGTEKGAA